MPNSTILNVIARLKTSLVNVLNRVTRLKVVARVQATM